MTARPSVVTTRAAALVALTGLASLSMAQVVPPAPKAPPAPPPAYTPPAPPPPAAPAPPPEPEVKVPDIVQRDAKGTVIEYPIPADEVAIGMLEGLDPAKAALRDQVKLERRAKLDARLATNVAAALSVRAAMRNPDAIQMQQIIAMRSQIQAVNFQPSMADMMVSAGALTPRQAEACKKAANAYGLALMKQQEEKQGRSSAETQRWIPVNAGRMASLEGLTAFDRLLRDAGEKWPQIKPTLKPAVDESPELAAAETMLASATGPDKASAMEAVISRLNADQQAQVIRAVATPMPTNPVVPDGVRPGGGASPPPGTTARPVRATPATRPAEQK